LTGAVIGAAVTLALHVHRILLDRNQQNTDAVTNNQQRAELQNLEVVFNRLIVLAEQCLSLGTHAAETQQPPDTGTLHHHTINSQALDVCADTDQALGSGIELMKMAKLPVAGATSNFHNTPALDIDGRKTASHARKGNSL
jgi:hypothetical protein